MRPPRTERFRRCVAMAPPSPEDRADFARLAPFEDTKPCACGSRNRVRNTDGAAFCQRCGCQHSKPLPSRFTFGASQ